MIDNLFNNLLKKIISTLDEFSYKELMNCLKLKDPIAVNEALKEVISEKQKKSISMLYLFWKKHPNKLIREYAFIHLSNLIDIQQLESFLKDHQDIEKNIQILIQKYGFLKKINL